MNESPHHPPVSWSVPMARPGWPTAGPSSCRSPQGAAWQAAMQGGRGRGRMRRQGRGRRQRQQGRGRSHPALDLDPELEFAPGQWVVVGGSALLLQPPARY